MSSKKDKYAELENSIRSLQRVIEMRKSKAQIDEAIAAVGVANAALDDVRRSEGINLPFSILGVLFGGITGGLSYAVGGLVIGAVVDVFVGGESDRQPYDYITGLSNIVKALNGKSGKEV